MKTGDKSNSSIRPSALSVINARLHKTATGMGLLVGRTPDGPTADDAPRGPDWVQASPTWIASALGAAMAKDGGGWYVLDRREAFVGDGPWRFVVHGNAMVVWRDADKSLVAAPESCPHLGASLAAGRVEDGRLVCAWHGLRLDRRGFRDWRCHTMHDDGVLVWVRLATPGESLLDAPVIAPRPAFGVAATIATHIRCDPQDVLANRLDPWHGAHYHPHSFGALEVLERRTDEVRVRVVYRVLGPIGVEVDATFHCPDPRTIVMTIVAGDGIGSVVETHATPVSPGRTLLVETTIATSDRAAFDWVRRVPTLARVIRPLIEARARKLWVEDVAYAERRYALRMAAATPKLVPNRGLPKEGSDDTPRPISERRPHR